MDPITAPEFVWLLTVLNLLWSVPATAISARSALLAGHPGHGKVWYVYEMLGTNRLEVVTMLSYSVVWSLLEVDNFLPNPGYDRSLLVIYRKVL